MKSRIVLAVVGIGMVAYASLVDARHIKKEVQEFNTPPVEITLEEAPMIDIKEIVFETETETETEEIVAEEEEVATGYLGGYTLTAYEWTGDPCANGNYPTCGYTAACNSLPLGTRIYIEGLGEYVIEDRGGMADEVIDIYMGDYDSCIQFGIQHADVYIIY